MAMSLFSYFEELSDGEGASECPIAMGIKRKAKQKIGFLSIESMVEVSRDKEGFKGSWFTAKILRREGNRNLLVEFQTLFSQNQKLTENVDISSVRPLPPPPAADQIYEPGDAVDAFHRGGWWKGVVGEVEVLENKSRSYKVVFEEENSSEKSEFFRSESLRFHLVCNGGRWVRSPKLKELQCEDNIGQQFEVVVSAMSSTSLQDHTEEESSPCQMSYAIALNHKSSIENPLGEQHNVVSKGTASEMGSEGCSSTKDPEFSTEINMQNGGYQEGNVGNSNQSSAMMIVKTEEEEEMPFRKSSSFWEYVDSLEVFRFLPQKPHFAPLFECNEATREGYAIGHMLTFATVVEKTLELKVDKSREVFDSYLEALANLETLGFDVKAVVERIYKLLSIKSQKEELENQSKCIHSGMEECNGEKAQMEEEINAIHKMISELEERLALILSEKATKDSKINLLQNDANSICAKIMNLKLDFESQVAAPW